MLRVPPCRSFLHVLVALILACRCRCFHVGENLTSGSTDSTFMLLSGVSATSEMCLTSNGQTVGLEACLHAIAVGDGRELWSFQTGGQLLHVTSKKCAGASGGAAGAGVVMRDCNGADSWELLASGQVKVGALCLSQSGTAAGTENIAAKAAAMATSTADIVTHGASAAVDMNEASYWASRFDETSPVTLSIDLGGEHSLEALKISWVFPARAFTVSMSGDGEHWSEVFATSVNVENTTTIRLGSKRASKVKVVMQEPHALYGVVQGHSLYGVRSVSILTPGLRAVVDDCASAAKSKDARDKFFAAFVSEFDPAAARALQGDLPSLVATKASLSATVSEVAGLIPKALSVCRQGGGISFAGVWTGALPEASFQTTTTLSSTAGSSSTARVESLLASAIDAEYGVGIDSMNKLLGSARSAIVALRSLAK